MDPKDPPLHKQAPAESAAGGAPAPDALEQENGPDIDGVVPSYAYHETPMVGIGGSAGSIRALQAFFESMPADSGLVLVVILHLSPTTRAPWPRCCRSGPGCRCSRQRTRSAPSATTCT